MNTPQSETESTSSMPEWYDPFEEPRTIPNGWDMSQLYTEVEQD